MASEPGRGSISAFVGLGSNLCDPEAQVNLALAELADLPQTRLTACSALYLTAPVGPQDQPDFVNAVAVMETRLGARTLLDALQAVERRHGRVRDLNRWGPRVLDLDLLLFGEAVIDRPGLRVPHPELAKRAFVLLPLADVAPGVLPVPGQGTLGQLLAACPGQEIRRLGPPSGCEGKTVPAESPACFLARTGIPSPAAEVRGNEPSR